MFLCRWLALTFVDGYNGESADVAEGRLEGCRLVYGGVPVCHGRIVLCFFYVFLSYLNRFVYGFCLIWNSSSSHVWL